MLLAKRTKPPFQWSFPGGSLEPGENAETAAIREAKEEVSADIEIIAEAGTREFVLANADRRYVISVFAARLIDGEPQAGPEASEIGWFDVAEIATLDTTEKLADYAALAQRLFLAAKA